MKIVVLDRSSVGEDVSVEAIKQFGEVDFYNSTPDELVAELDRGCKYRCGKQKSDE